MKLALLLLLLLVASAHCFYVYLKNDDEPSTSLTRTVKMTLNGNETLLPLIGNTETKSPWISATDSVRFALEDLPGMFVTMTPGPVGLPPLLQLSTNYTVGVTYVGTGNSRMIMKFKPRGLFPSYVCNQFATQIGCHKIPLIGSVQQADTFTDVVLFTTDYEISFVEQ